MTKIYGMLAAWEVQGFAIQEVQRGVEIFVTESTLEELVGTRVCLLHSGVIRREEVTEEVAITKETN